jgi:hypothetical protein
MGTRLLLLGAGSFAPVLLVLFHSLRNPGDGDILPILTVLLPGLWFTVPGTIAWIFDLTSGARLSRAGRDGFVLVSYLGIAANIFMPLVLIQLESWS